MNAEQQSKQWSQIVAKAWADANFKKRLLAEPAAVLKEYGMAVPSGVNVKVVENTNTVRYLTVPLRTEAEVSEGDLARISGGVVGYDFGTEARHSR